VDDAGTARTNFIHAGSNLASGPAPDGGIREQSRENFMECDRVEKLNDLLSRQMISGDNATVSQIYLKRGASCRVILTSMSSTRGSSPAN